MEITHALYPSYGYAALLIVGAILLALGWPWEKLLFVAIGVGCILFDLWRPYANDFGGWLLTGAVFVFYGLVDFIGDFIIWNRERKERKKWSNVKLIGYDRFGNRMDK